MSKKFTKVLTFKVEGEIDDNITKPESIINNYTWSFNDNLDGNVQLFGHHKDTRGRITKITKLPKVYNWSSKKPEPVIYM